MWMLAALGPFRDLSRWARGSGLEIVLLASGAVLLVRAARWLLARSVVPVNGRSWWVALRHRPGADAAPDDGDPSSELRRRRALTQALSWLFTALVTLIVGAMVAVRLGVPLASVVPPATVAGVAVGFGAQRIVQDVLSGFFLLAERQLNVGDVVRISDPGSTTGVGGTVEDVTLRVTRLRTVKGEVVFIPNGEIRQVTNLSVEWARLVIDVPLRASDDVTMAIGVLRQVGEGMAADERWQDVLLEKPEVLGVETLDVGIVRVRVVVKVRASNQWEAARELRLRITSSLAGAGITPLLPVSVPGFGE